MITSFLFYLLYNFLFFISTPLRALPDATLPANLNSAIASVNGYISAVDFIFPTTTFLTILASILTIEGLILIYKLIMWVVRKIPGIN